MVAQNGSEWRGENVKRTETTLIDDIDGSKMEVRTVSFALAGTEYEIDLAPHNAHRMRNALREFIAYSRSPKPKQPRTEEHRRHSAAIRAWAKTEGYEVPAAGRMKSEIYRAYQQARAEGKVK